MKYQLLKKDDCEDGFRRELYAMNLSNVWSFVYKRKKAMWQIGEIGKKTREYYNIQKFYDHWVFLREKIVD